MRQVTIKDVAAATGTSTATVSRALQDKPGVSEELRAKLKQVAAQLNYVSRNSSKQARTLLLVFPAQYFQQGSIIYGRGVEVLFQRTAKAGIMMTSLSDDAAELATLQRVITDQDVSVLTYFCTEPDPSVVDIAVKRGLPIVLIHRHDKGPNTSSFVVNDYLGGLQVADHFYQTDRRECIFVVPTVDQHKYSTQQRYAGFRDRMLSYGLTVKFVAIPQLSLSERIPYLKEKAGDFDALFAYSDLQAREFIEASKLHGIRIPEDVSVVGYNNSHHVTTTDPQLSSVHWPIDKVCHCVMDHIERYAGGQKDAFPIHLAIDPELIIRGSSAVSTHQA